MIVACFASHVHRVQQVLDAAVTHRRKVVYVGRSMVRNMAVARDLGYLKVPANTLIELRDIDKFQPHEVVIISTGSQGEPLSALSRMAIREHPVIQLNRATPSCSASSLIPGNENAVYRVINGLSKLGTQVVHKGNALVHVSGHASAGELLFCYNIVRAAQRDAGARRGPPPDRQRRSGRRHRRAAGADDHRRGRRVVDLHRTAGPGSSARSTPATSSSTAAPSATSPRPR